MSDLFEIVIEETVLTEKQSDSALLHELETSVRVYNNNADLIEHLKTIQDADYQHIKQISDIFIKRGNNLIIKNQYGYLEIETKINSQTSKTECEKTKCA